MSDRLSLIAGSGGLVFEVIAAARERGWEVQVLSLPGRRAPPSIPLVRFDPANPRPALNAIRSFGASMIALVGGVVLSDRDREALLGLFGGPRQSVGDTELARLANFLEREAGARLVGAHEIAPHLLAPEGLICGPVPAPELAEIGEIAVRRARAAGSLDLGQAIVVSGRRTVALEDIVGTDALLHRVRAYRRRLLAGDGRSTLVFAKAAKPDQPLAIDLPAIGPVTIANARKAGISLVAVQAGATLLIERSKLAAAASTAGIPVIGVKISND